MSDGFVGRTFGDFALKEKLGAGGAGEVYLAEQLALGRQAVIKVMARQAEATADAQERFLREARLASRLDHPFAAHVYAFGAEADGTLWIAMELVRGTPLDKLISNQGPIALARFVPLFERLCEVLNAAHEQDIVHRDIKPANVMVLQRAGKLLPKLLDLGIARAAATEAIPEIFDPEAPMPSGIVSTATPVSSPDTSAGAGRVEVVTMSGSLAGRLTRSESMHLTQLGSVVGTPHYMAPEQWADASRAGAKADIYSLAILAFQCLTGRVPFDAKTLKAMARAHASLPLPALGDGLSEQVHAVLSKGAAKRPEDRFASPLEFAAALRVASGLGVEPAALPQLEEGLRDNLLSKAPQPIAEAVAALESARTARRALDAVLMVGRVLSRYFGVLSIAGRARVGPGADRDADEVTVLLGRLQGDSLSDGEWLDLSQRILLPFFSKQDAHPLPELVKYFAEGASASLSKLLESTPLSKDVSEEAALQHLHESVAQLTIVLERIAFLCDTTLVVQNAFAERWMGTRRLERLAVPLLGELKKGEIAIVDSLGAIILQLTPLLQCIAPSGGAIDELFFIEGSGRHGARLVAIPAPFERQDESVWSWMVAHGLVQEGAGRQRAVERAPYKGLSTFSTDDADNYFGRERETEAFANRMRRESFLVVVGPSGTGKSSFILAGVLPLLPKTWRPVVFRPGATPLAALRARLEQESLPSPEDGSERLVATLPSDSNLVLVVDQFEELVTLCQDAATRDRFGRALLEAARHPSGRIRVVVTLRDDFLIKVQQLPAFRETLSNSLQLLGTPAPEDLQRVVTEPARRVGFSFDDVDLPKKMVAAVSEYSSALALLSFTASQLWELRDRQLRLMRVKTYDALGGVGGALANHAEATLAALNGDEQKMVREAFRHLVTAQGTRAVLSKKEALEVLGNSAIASTVLEKLVNARLLVSSETADGNDSIEVIHEALISAWPRLVSWQREDAESARLRDSLRASARQWDERGRPSGLLWRKETLAEYRVWRPRFPGRLTQLEESFATASLRDEARSQLIRRSLAVLAFVVLSVALLVVLERNREVRLRIQKLWQEQGRLALISRRPMDAAAFLNAAEEAGASGGALELMRSGTSFLLAGTRGTAALLDGRVMTLVRSADGSLLAAGDRTQITVQRLATGEVLQRLARPNCRSAVFHPSRRELVVVCGSEAAPNVTVLDLETGAVRSFAAPVLLHALRVSCGRIFATGVSDALWTIEPNDTLSRIEALKGSIALEMDASEHHVVVFAGREVARESPRRAFIYDACDQRGMLTELDDQPVRYASFSPDGAHVVLGRPSSLQMVRAKDATAVWRTPALLMGLTAVKLGAGIAIVGNADGAVMGFDAESGAMRYSLTVSGSNGTIAFARGHFFVAAADGVVRKLSPSNGRVLWEHHGHTGAVVWMAAADDELVTGGVDGMVWRWLPEHPVNATYPVSATAMGRTNDEVFFGDREGVGILRIDGGVLSVARPDAGDSDVYGLLPSPSGQRLLIERDPSGVAWFDFETGRWSDMGAYREANYGWSSDGRTILEIYPYTGKLVTIDAATAKELSTISLPDVVRVAQLGSSGLALGTTGDLILLDASFTTERARVRAHASQANWFIDAANRQVVTAGYSDGIIAAWRIGESIEALGSIRDAPKGVVSAALLEGGERVVAVFQTGQISVFDFKEGVALVSASIGRRITAAAAARRLEDIVIQPEGDSARLWWQAATTSPCRLTRTLSGERLVFQQQTCRTP